MCSYIHFLSEKRGENKNKVNYFAGKKHKDYQSYLIIYLKNPYFQLLL